MMPPKVSICIPTYNRKNFLRETLDSIQAQTFKNCEIIIVDDGSTDGTEEMIKELDGPIRYYWQQNGGDAAARNRLIELAEGEYISFIDSDDLLMPDAIERMMEVMARTTEDVIVYGAYLGIDEKGNVVRPGKRKLYSGYVTKHLFQDIFIHSCGSIFPSRILKGGAAFDTSLKVCSDYDLWLRLSIQYPFFALPDPTFKRRRHPANLSTASFENRLTELKVLERFYFEKGGRDVVPRAAAMRRLSKEQYRVGICALKENNCQEACDYLAMSFRTRPNVKSLIYWMKATMAKKFGLS